MNKRKSRKSDIDSKKVYFLEIGLILALAACLVAFEWKKYDISKVDIATRDVKVDFESVIIPTKHVVKPPPPKTIPSSPTLLNIVNDDEEVEDIIMPDIDIKDFTNDIWGDYSLEPEVEYFEDDTEYLIVEVQPEFPGGEAGRLMYLRDNLKYPVAAKEAGIQGIVYVSFVVMPDGSVGNIEVLRGIGGGCDEEAVRVVKNMPKWKPGEQRGNKVKVRFSMQVKFTLQK
ncbi:energy transducer TonB [Odoribacter sp. OttesenSCG-928-L07]|nr:energy transducer TonB [Odoribacter sp. OttesenSCG-928-L07]MDL2238677.1 energy transducer TonB [Bacteroidales bacterium OttesenSCG-928-L14]